VERVKAYVNGFNLYHGLKTRHGHKYLWLDLQALAVRLLKPSQHLVAVEYFTARVRNQAESEQRQAVYLDALAAHYPLVKVVQGRFQKKTHECRSCGCQWVSYEEKETDVSIAVQLVEDGVRGVFDTALLISADSDLCPAVRSLKRLNPGKRVIAVFPPRRHSEDLRKAANGMIKIYDVTVRNSQLPPLVATGITLTRLKHWTRA
jgi:uncharacterized LabA/DUF88 family protein